MADPQFPPEIFEKFIGHLADGEDASERRSNLRTCCYVSRIWCGLAQPILFSQVVLQSWTESQVEQFYESISTRPDLQVAFLCIKLDMQEPCPRLVDVIQRLTKLRCLRLILDEFPYASLHHDFLSHLPPTLKSTRITSLSLASICDFPVQLFFHLVALEELALKDMTYGGLKDPTPSPLDPSRWKPQLRVLLLSTTRYEEADIVPWFLASECAFDLSRLSTFWAIERSNSDVAYGLVCGLVASVSSSLEDVLIDPPTGCVGNQPLTNTFPSQELQSLRIATVAMLQDGYESFNAVPWLINFLTNLPEPDKLEELELPCEFRGSNCKSQQGLIRQGWPKVDILLGSSVFRNLKDVRIICYCERGNDESFMLRSSLNLILPQLLKRGILRVEYTGLTSYVTSRIRPWLD
ncbi:hypothetical protein BDN72DRAFT_958632 [Pluteus cervinus]|uniref:Uncharacterized protein n=1 Tax=Pluteus cervinus TaxID=181527 RepID=A0ACD3AYS6_9AGAR|nr:hypothetical protein BDN72DRAFT_958632 [Pluteus cervinus]